MHGKTKGTESTVSMPFHARRWRAGMQQDNPASDFDRELSALLSAHKAVEGLDVRVHVRTCDCCNAIAILLGNLRRDLWQLHEGRDL